LFHRGLYLHAVGGDWPIVFITRTASTLRIEPGSLPISLTMVATNRAALPKPGA